MGDPAALYLAEEALKLAESGGHLQSAGRLRVLLASFGGAAEHAPGTRTLPPAGSWRQYVSHEP